ncbi:MAG: phosphatidate cytidylyltransferase [Clostridia bacterium]|nr:phosphatidate cytidylyltransferase [Clostridia bacterium]
MKTRILTGVISICILLPVLIFSNSILLPIAIALCSLIAVYEMLSCIGLKSAVAFSLPYYLLAAGLPFLIRYLATSRYFTSILFACAVICMLYLFSVLIFSHGRYRLNDLSVAFFSLVYILVGFNAILWIHDTVPAGGYVYLIAFLGAWITDTFAYFCGMLFGKGGKHKLIPDVSPKKTWEGSIGGVVFCILSMILFGIIVEAIDQSISANLIVLALLGLVVSVVSQIGDLSMSVIKRTYGIKDYGKLFPGHGGVLDRFDSVLAVAAILAVFCSFFSLFEVIV